MPYKKSYRKKGRKRNFGSRLAKLGQSYSPKDSIAWKAFRLAKKVADAVNVEYKYTQIDDTGTAQSYSGGYAEICSPVVGTSDITRIGDSIKIQHLSLRGCAKYNSAGSDGQTVRLVIFKDKQNKVSAVSDIVDSVGTVTAPFFNKVYDNRFQTKFIYDRTFYVNSQKIEVPFHIELPINMHKQFQAGTTTVQSGSLKYLIISDQATNGPSITMHGRVTFTDN